MKTLMEIGDEVKYQRGGRARQGKVLHFSYRAGGIEQVLIGSLGAASEYYDCEDVTIVHPV